MLYYFGGTVASALVVLLFVKRADNQQRLQRAVISLQKANNHISLNLMALLFQQSPCF